MKKTILAVTLALTACGGSDEPGPERARAGLEATPIGTHAGPGACGVSNAYRVTSAAGIRFSQASILNKRTMETVDRWLRDHAIPIIGTKGGGLVEISVPAHYACRTRNSRPGARLSEHAKGNAIDISAFILADGTRLTVLGDWTGKNSKILRALHASACGPFGTVLGPNSDRHHQDHFHFDVADYRSGPYCR